MVKLIQMHFIIIELAGNVTLLTSAHYLIELFKIVAGGDGKQLIYVLMMALSAYR